MSLLNPQSPITLCNLGVGATFGESVLQDLPRDSTVVTKTTCELLRVEQQDFRLIWEVSTKVFFPFSLNIQSLKKCFVTFRFNNVRAKQLLSIILNYSSRWHFWRRKKNVRMQMVFDREM